MKPLFKLSMQVNMITVNIKTIVTLLQILQYNCSNSHCFSFM